MERLTKQDKDGYAVMDCDNCELKRKNECTAYSCRNRLKDRLAHYEDLEEQGRIITLPCQWGAKLYSIFAAAHNLLNNGEPPIREIQLVEDNVCPVVRQFGKTVFLTRAEAEAALAALEE